MAGVIGKLAGMRPSELNKIRTPKMATRVNEKLISKSESRHAIRDGNSNSSNTLVSEASGKS